MLIMLPLLLANPVHSADRDRGAAPSIAQRDVVILEGDTLRTIARRELGKTGLSQHLADYNNIAVSDELEPGQLIKIPVYAPVEREFATVVFVKGSVAQLNNKPVARDDEIYINDLLVTGDDGFVSLLFSSGSVINLQPNTQVKLVRLNCLPGNSECLIEVESKTGQMSSDVDSRPGQPTNFRINTPYASAAVRGTKFEVDSRQSSALVGVTDGDVVVSALSQDVLLNRGFGSVTKKGEPAGQPIPLLPPPVYRFIPSRAAVGDFVSWWALSAANAYQALLSIDQEGRKVIASYNRNNSVLPINLLEAGDYYLNVRGVDENGLKGFVTTTRITIAAIDETISPVDTTIARTGDEFLVAVEELSDNAAGYEIQVSKTTDFNDPLSVDVTELGTARFKLEGDKIYTRARVLLDPQTVSAFGTITESR